MLLAIAVLAVAVGVTIYFLARSSPEFGTAAPFFYQLNSDDISRISIAVGGNSQSFRWDAAQNAWVFEDGSAVDPNRFGGMPVLVAGPRIKRELPEVTDVTPYGLDPPASTVTIGLDNQREFVVLIGKTTPDGSAHYVMQSGTTTVLLVDSAWGNVIEGMVADPPHPATATADTSS